MAVRTPPAVRPYDAPKVKIGEPGSAESKPVLLLMSPAPLESSFSGALSIKKVVNASITNVMFSNNTATGGTSRDSLVPSSAAAASSAASPCAGATAAPLSGGGSSGRGGGVFIDGVPVVITASAFTDGAAGVGGGIYVTGRLSAVTVRDTAVVRNRAQTGGGLAAGDEATVRVIGGAVRSNRAASGGGALLSDNSSVYFEASVVESNSAAFAGGAAVVGAAATLSASADSRVVANTASIGGVAYLCSSTAQLPAFLQSSTNASVTVTNNRRDYQQMPSRLRACDEFPALSLRHNSRNVAWRPHASPRSAADWGDNFADSNVAVSVSAPAAVHSGSDLAPFVTLRDGRGQLIRALPGVAITVECDEPVLGRQVTNAYAPSSALVGVTLTGTPGAVYDLTFSVASPLLPGGLLQARVRVAILLCGMLEAFNNATSLCECITGSQREPPVVGDDRRCACADGFHVFSGLSGIECRGCPARGATCARGLLVPAEGWWNSSPESEDLQPCLVAAACSTTAGGANPTSSRLSTLLQYQVAALANASGQYTPTELVRRGQLSVAEWRQLQCSEGYTGVLCASCAPGWGRIRMNECVKCTGYEDNTGALAGMMAVNALVLLVTSAREFYACHLANLTALLTRHLSVLWPYPMPLFQNCRSTAHRSNYHKRRPCLVTAPHYHAFVPPYPCSSS